MNYDEYIEKVDKFTGEEVASRLKNRLYRLGSKFNKEVIEGIGGMTMSERLYWFGLVERFDSLQTEKDQNLIYRKLCANP